MKKMINVTKNGKEVYVIVDDAHMQAHPQITESLLAEAIGKVDYKPPFQMVTVNMDRTIGTDMCVSTGPDDKIVWQSRKGRTTPSRMVLGREPEPTSLVTVGICTDDDGLETVFTAFPGQLAPKELHDPRLREDERPEAEAFWAVHALVAEE